MLRYVWLFAFPARGKRKNITMLLHYKLLKLCIHYYYSSLACCTTQTKSDKKKKDYYKVHTQAAAVLCRRHLRSTMTPSSTIGQNLPSCYVLLEPVDNKTAHWKGRVVESGWGSWALLVQKEALVIQFHSYCGQGGGWAKGSEHGRVTSRMYSHCLADWSCYFRALCWRLYNQIC